MNKRVVFHDNTGLMLQTPNDGFLQRLLYSSYYAGDCGKAGIHVHQCGWIGVYDIYPGSISDTDYFKLSGMFDIQKKFQEKDRGHKFVNIFD